IIIYAFFPPELFAEGRHLEQDSAYFPWKDFFDLLKYKTRRRTLVENRFPIFQNRPEVLFDIFLGNDLKTSQATTYYKGFYSMTDNQEIQLADVKKGFEKFARGWLTEDQAEKFQGLIRKWKGDGVKVVLIQPPVYLNVENFIFWPDLYEHYEKII